MNYRLGSDEGVSSARDGGDAFASRPGTPLLPAFTGWVVARLLVLVAYVAASWYAAANTSPRADRTLADGLFIWDGMFYRVIATEWYSPERADMARFFPGFPVIGWLVERVGGRGDVALVVVNNVAALAAAILLWRLVDSVIGDRAAATRASWMVSILPSAFVLTLAYSEGLALLLTIVTLTYLHRQQFALAGGVAFAAAMLRPVGVLLVVAIAVELWQSRRHVPIWQTVVALIAPVTGLAVGMWWISRSYAGDLRIAFTSQQAIRGGFQDPFTRLVEPFYRLFRGDGSDLVNVAFAAVLIGLLWVMVRRRLPASWIAYSAVSLAVLVSAQVIDSIGRYGMTVVPFVVALALWAQARWQQVLVAGVGSVGLVALASLAWLGAVVP